jgi:hypothetical protein
MISFSEIKNYVSKFISSSTGSSIISKKDIIKMLDANRRVHSYNYDSLSSIPEEYRKNISTALFNTKNNNNQYIKLYFEYIKNIPSKYRRTEELKFFQTFIDMHRIFIKCYDDILNNIDKLIEEKEINKYNAKITFFLIMGIIEQSKTFINFSEYMFSGLLIPITDTFRARMNVITGTNLKDPKPYRLNFLNQNIKTVTKLIEEIYPLENVANPIEKLVEKIKKNNQNFNIISSDDKDQSILLQGELIGSLSLSLVGEGIKNFAIFGWFGKTWVNLVHYYIQIVKKRKEYMESQVAYLMELQSEEQENSEEFNRLAEIINNYNDRIAKDEKTINEYYESE